MNSRAWLNLAAVDEYGKAYGEELNGAAQNVLQHALKEEYRGNHYDAGSGILVVSGRRAKAVQQTANYYSRLFSDAPELQGTRESYAMKENTLLDPERRARLSEFFFWTAWAAVTERTEDAATYTNNWPHEPLIGNQSTAGTSG